MYFTTYTEQIKVFWIITLSWECYDNICGMLDFLIDNIFVMFGGRVFQQTVGIPMGNNCAPLLAD